MSLAIAALGPLVVAVDGRPIEIQRKARALLVYLALQQDPQDRNRLADLLWPDQPPEKSRHSLRNCLLELRKAIGAEHGSLRATFTTCWFDGSASDVARFDGTVGDTVPELHATVALYRGSLLDGFPLIASEPWNEWLDAERMRLEELLKGRLFRLAELHAIARKHDLAEVAARRLVRIDPYGTRSNRLLMRVLAAGGRSPEAVQHYRNFAAMLQRELGVGPGRRTRAFYEKICSSSPVEQSTLQLLAEAREELARLRAELSHERAAAA